MGLLIEPTHMEDEGEDEDQENEKEDERDGEESKRIKTTTTAHEAWMTCATHLEPMSRVRQ